jgi:hypothetical protein
MASPALLPIVTTNCATICEMNETPRSFKERPLFAMHAGRDESDTTITCDPAVVTATENCEKAIRAIFFCFWWGRAWRGLGACLARQLKGHTCGLQ